MPIRIKICGVTRPEDIEAAARFGADAVGINFHPQSPRYVEPQMAPHLIQTIPPLMSVVGVFVHLPFRQVSALAYQLGLRGVQWYSDTPEPRSPFPFALIPAFRVKDSSNLQQILNYLQTCRSTGYLPSAILVDAFVEGHMGGTGHKAPWDLLREFRPGVPLILAGGLTPDNVTEAIYTVRPYGIDVASGVESSPGKKDWAKLKQFIQNAQEAASAIDHPSSE